MKKTFLCIVCALSILLLSFLPVSASENYADIWEIFGLSKEEFMELHDDKGMIVFEIPHVYADSYNKAEAIKLTNNQFDYIWKLSTYNYTFPNSNGTIGTFIGSANAEYLYCTLYNGGNVLFSQKGTLTLNLFAYANDIDLIVYHSDSSTTSYSVPINYESITATSEVVIDNFNANIVKIEIKYNRPITQSDGTKYIGGGVSDYGYVLGTGEVIETDHSKNIFELLQSFVANFWNNIVVSVGNAFGFLQNFISGFWSGLQTNLTDVLDSYWSATAPSSSQFNSDMNSLQKHEDVVMSDVSSRIDNLEFQDYEISSNVGGEVVFITGIMQSLFDASGQYSTVFTTSVILLACCMLIGLVAFWKR